MGKRYSKDQLLEWLREWAKKHNKSPSARDINNDKEIPSAETYKNYFGSFNYAKELAGLETYEYKKEQLLQWLREWANKYNKSPSIRDIEKTKEMPSVTVYKRHFGSFNRAKELAGVDIFKFDSELNYVDGLLKEWKDGRKGEISETTIKNYLRHLTYLEAFLKENGKTMQEMTVMDIKDYVLKIKDQYSKNSLDYKFSAIQNFLKYFLRKAIIEKKEPLFELSMIEEINKFFKIQLKQLEEDAYEDEALSEEEVKIIKERLSDYPMLQTMFILDLNLGLRASEFARIKTTQGLIINMKQARKGDVWIDLSRGILMIFRKKTKKPHLVSLTQKMVQLVKKQLMLRKINGVNHEFLFFSKKGKPLRDHSIYSYYQQISKITNIKITSHKVRRTMATLLEKRGVPHSIIQRRMGHKPKDVTQRYQRISIKERQQILEDNVGIL